ncbi:DNA helicase RecQ [Rubripirellula amarantea]|nr:DNA helicase RecQ [Rubripirellula amarantea]
MPSSPPVPSIATEVLKQYWGYESFRPLQAESVSAVLQRRDSLTVLPTGGGKSICFQVPAMCMDGLAVVVSPLISLMKDQVDALRTCGIEAAFVNSTQSEQDKRDVANSIRSGELKLLYMAPERLLMPRTIDFLKSSGVSFFAIDEAHCISNWGHDFRPEYRGLRTLKQQFPGVAVHAYTATASEGVRNDIAEQLGLKNAEILVGDFDRPNLTYRMLRTQGRIGQVMEVVNRHQGESGIVYCISRKEVERVAATLTSNGVSALPYHAGMDDGKRQANQDAFINEKCDVIVATVAFGMGIDKSNVRYVVHAGMPKSIEHYQQESGRAGRDGLESECVLLYSGGDLVTWKKIMSGEPGGLRAAVASLDAMYDLCSGAVCRHRAIVSYFGQEYATDSCDACDVCLEEIELAESPIVIGQKILSCIVRLNQRFGAAHTAKVLIGSKESRITDLRHDQLSTYGLMAREGSAAIRMWIDQLVAQGFINRTGEYQTLSLSDSGWQLIRGEVTPRLTKAGPETKSRASSAGKSKAGKEASWEGVDRGLFDRLRQVRSQLAASAKVPAYIVFGDATLREMAIARPSDLKKLGLLKGIGTKKLADYGDVFLDEIKSYCVEHNVAQDQSA